MPTNTITDWFHFRRVKPVDWICTYFDLPSFSYYFNKLKDYGCVAYYRFEEQAGSPALDSTGNGFNLNDFGGANRGVGKDGQCLSVSTANTGLINPKPFQFSGGQFTFSFWAKGNAINFIFVNGFDTGVGCGVAMYDDGVHLVYEWANGTGGHHINHATIADNNWHFIVCGYDGANFFLGVDGGALTTTADTYVDPDLTNGHDFEIPATASSASVNVDEFAVFNMPLTGAQITQLYNGGNGWFPFDQVASEIIVQYNFAASNNFCLPRRPIQPANCNFGLCIKYRIGGQVYRYKLWNIDGLTLDDQDAPLYNGDPIKKNFVLEVWSLTGSNYVQNINALRFPTSVRYDLTQDLRNRTAQAMALSNEVKASDIAIPLVLPFNFGSASAWLDNPDDSLGIIPGVAAAPLVPTVSVVINQNNSPYVTQWGITNIYCDTSTAIAGFQIYLPTAPFDGQKIVAGALNKIADQGLTILVSGNGKNINGASSYSLTSNNEIATFTYSAPVGMWIVS